MASMATVYTFGPAEYSGAARGRGAFGDVEAECSDRGCEVGGRGY